MRRGCTSLGDIKCDECQRLIPYPERYLVIDQEEGAVLRLCVDCCLSKGYARYTEEKGQRVLTFFVGEP
jgi:sulfur relay (sulfurtransferase) complex TusBCD TusD component (DsrE family)